MNIFYSFRIYYGRVRYMISRYRQRKKLERKFREKGGCLGVSSQLLNPNYIDIGKNVRIKEGYRIECYNVFYGQVFNPRLILEDGVIIGPRFTGLIADTVCIKKDTILAGNVTLVSENHGIDPESSIPYHAQPLNTGPITIGEGCWLGQNVTVLPNVIIGDKCIIGSNSVVAKDIPPYSIAVGSPARVIKQYNFEEHKWQNLTK